MARRRLLLAAGIATMLAIVAHPRPAIADGPRRFALLVGVNDGDRDEQQLRYAESDADKIADILRELGGFAADDVEVLRGVTATAFRRSLAALSARAERSGGDSVLFVFYSGHADGEALHLAGTRLPTRELRELIDASGATVRVLVVDACRSGGLTRRKGGRPGPAFAVDIEDRLRSRGVAILSSSADSEDSHESDRFKASFFTHYLASALRGAADDDTNGRVTLTEAFTFASQRTVSATTQTAAGTQHPTYRYDLTGRQDLVLTYTAVQRGIGSLTFDEAGTYLVQERDINGGTVVEVTVGGSARVVAVATGDYFITRRATDHLLQGKFSVAGGATTAVGAGHMQRIAYAQVVRKGGTTLRTSSGAFAMLGARGGLGAQRTGLRSEVGARIDRPALSFELRLHGTFATRTEEAVTISSRELGVSIGALRVVDRGSWSFGAGLVAGPVWAAESKAGAGPGDPGVDGLGGMLGGIGQLQRSLTARTYARVDVGALGYWYGDDGSDQGGVGVRLVWSLAAGVGAYL